MEDIKKRRTSRKKVRQGRNERSISTNIERMSGMEGRMSGKEGWAPRKDSKVGVTLRKKGCYGRNGVMKRMIFIKVAR